MDGYYAWMLVATALVLMMTTPALALFYGGMTRSKSVLNMMMMSYVALAVVGIVFVLWGWSMGWGADGLGNANEKLIANPFDMFALDGVSEGNYIFVLFQMTFAVITAALISGAIADRVKLSSWIVFLPVWVTAVYFPIAHNVWGGGWLYAHFPNLDYAGGTVVHINAGIAGLVAALVMGKRRGYGTEMFAPHNLTLSVAGAALLWVGWFGFNAGSAVTAGASAGMAMAVTQIATAAAALAWMFLEWGARGKPSVLGIVSGAVAGLVAITPASGFVLPGPALLIGVVAGLSGFWGATALKHMCGYDDSLDAFGVHGICGIVGSLMVGYLAYGPLSATAALPEGSAGSLEQFLKQVYATAAVFAFSAIATFVLLKATDVVVGLRVPEEEEREGLDVTQHGERIA